MVTSKIENRKIEVEEIDWSEPQIVRCDNIYILTNGGNISDKFAGVVIVKDGIFSIGEISSTWMKQSFTKVTEPITITFINK